LGLIPSAPGTVVKESDGFSRGRLFRVAGRIDPEWNAFAYNERKGKKYTTTYRWKSETLGILKRGGREREAFGRASGGGVEIREDRSRFLQGKERKGAASIAENPTRRRYSSRTKKKGLEYVHTWNL